MSAYLPGFVIAKVFATWDLTGLIIMISPDHSLLSSVDPSLGQAFSVVSILHFLHASSFMTYFSVLSSAFRALAALPTSSSIHSRAPRKGCLQVTPILPMDIP